MYITYERDRWNVISNMGEIARRNSAPLHQSQTIRIDPATASPKLDEIYNSKSPTAFKPRWLVDISRMALVRGSDICERYYTISYSWNQSGDYFKSSNGEYTRNDEGKHQIISYRTKKTKRYPRGRCKTRIPLKPRLVIFEYLVQQICKDVGARYIWWDQWCINQSNAEEKQEEIKKMHKIYKHAYCTLVLIPELEFIGEYLENTPIVLFDKIMQSEWVKRCTELR
ncbi:hypothetical protein BJV82DRAFT_583938 [Fennellomyces sp. T-0311]|nr:hypothetical protein BJV82DRAFT_583938 [Fennellomyces sp. T-0311]